MRRAKLYTLKEDEVIVAGDYIEYHSQRFPYDAMVPTLGDEVLFTYDTIRLPIHHVRKIEHGKNVDNFIAMSPEIQEMFDATYRDKVEFILTQAESLSKIATAYRDRINEYNSLPWYKRIFKFV